MHNHPTLGKENAAFSTLPAKQADTYQLLKRMIAATSIRVDGPLLLHALLVPLRGSGLVPSARDRGCHGPECGGCFLPFVQGSVASNINLRAVLLQNRAEKDL